MTEAPTNKKGVTSEADEEAVVEKQIADLEQELTNLDGPPPPLTLTDISQGAVALVDKYETRRKTITRYLAALKIKRLELRKAGLERQLEPHREVQRTVGETLDALMTQWHALNEEISQLRGTLGDTNTRAGSIESHIRQIDREIAKLRTTSQKEEA
jgi:chromosome segregation ATPase